MQRAHELLGDRFIDTLRHDGIRLIDEPTRAAINSNDGESNEWVRKRWFPDRAVLFDPDPS